MIRRAAPRPGALGQAATILLLLALAACSSAGRQAPAPLPAPVPTTAPATAPATTVSGNRGGHADPAERVVAAARALLAAPYRYGGEGPRGFDCSGLVTYVFRQVGVGLPRTAVDQGTAGRWVAPDELAPGDLVFFGRRRDKPHHVGLVVSRPGEPLRMIHASSSRGVVETAVSDSAYWIERLRFGRRVLAR